MKSASEEFTGAARETTDAASELSKQSENLRGEVSHVLTEIRADNGQTELYKWDESIATGVDKIDREHKECKDDMNTFHSMMLSGEGDGSSIKNKRVRWPTLFYALLTDGLKVFPLCGAQKFNA
ncbi:hypothetical protein V5T82_07035 [Magnetovibrio sp. PR-2]|uniref:hypothetical protein n=1 Tax=Magnetovibrio sp. PR-2 TaxID=3120356 RepID=UPI002FCE1D97